MGTRIETDYDDVNEYMDAVPRGEYIAKLIEVEEQDSSSGNPMLVWDFELIEEYKGSTVRGWTSLQEHALGDARKYFRAIKKTWKSGDDLEKLARKCIGKVKVRLVVGIRTTRDRDSGEERENNKIIGIFPVDSRSSAKEQTSSSKKSQRETTKDDEDKDDIPF